MKFFDYVNLLKLDTNIEDCNLTLPECDEFAAFIWEISYNHISNDDQWKLRRRYNDYESAADAYEKHVDSLTLDQLNGDNLDTDELWWRVCNTLEEMAYFIRFKCSNKQYFEIEG